MSRPLSTLAALLLPLAAAADTDVLVRAETAFAADVAELGVRDGFLRHLAEEAVVFRPLPTGARIWFEAQQAPDFTLVWRPWYAEIAGAGDFGYTIGPWTSRPVAEGARPDTYGFYATVWIKNAEGEWRVLADHGVPAGELAKVRDEVAVLGAQRAGPASGTYLMNTRYQALLEAALRLPSAQADAAVEVERVWLAEDVLALRSGGEPLQGDAAAKQVAEGELGSAPPALTVMAASGDLGMSLGGEPGRGAYLRLWRYHADAGWQLAADVATAVDAPPGE